MFTLVEPCCGSASLSLHLLGARRPILPYQGSKWRFRRGLSEMVEAMGYVGPPSRVELSDVGPWGRTMHMLLRPASLLDVIEHLRGFASEDARTVYDRLNRGPAASDDALYSAQYLFLQRLSFSGKAVAERDGCWASPGFNISSAYGVAATDRFGQVKPMVPSLIRVLTGYGEQLHLDRSVRCEQRPASLPVKPLNGPTIVYLDPPYAGSTRYPNGDMDRPAVVELAVAWSDAGASVIVSEGQAVQELQDRGWQARVLDRGRKDTSPFRGKQAEWVTYRARPSSADVTLDGAAKFAGLNPPV
ncbi:MAG: site-specific DNA-adenine methylase [Kiritimatiellia bacterium]|jgi:site-specific DNA-adenine methylase